MHAKQPLFAARCLMALPIALIALQLGIGAEPREKDLAAWWRFEEAQGRIIADESGRGNHLMVDAGSLVAGVEGRGLEIEPEKTVAWCPGSTTLDPRPQLTIEAWIHPRSALAAGYSTVLRKDNAYSLRFLDGSLAFILWCDGQPQSLALPKTPWAARWYHLAATWDGERMSLYVDGKLARSVAMKGPADASGEALYLGSQHRTHRFDGTIDEVRIYRRALTAAEIAAENQRGRQALAGSKGNFEPIATGREGVALRKPPREVKEIQQGLLWIDAEDFADYGGWILDTQFVHLMGSGYLIASGLGRPVADAETEVAIPRAGRWRVWVRAKDWLPEFSPGKFQVLLAGKPLAKVLGRDGHDQWSWHDCGWVELAAGPVRLGLHDLTGYYGRCDALVLAADADYRPPEKLEDLARERSRLTGVSIEPQPAGGYDVVVVGAGAAGSCAALASARMGSRTVLVQNRPVLGGNSSIELGVPINGAASLQRNARESGIIEEVGRIRARYGYHKMSDPFRIAAAGEKHLTVLLNRHACGVRMTTRGRIAAVEAVDTLTGARSLVEGQLFVDSTGDGWLGFFAGAKFRQGRESREEFNEDLAPAGADRITMSGCLMGDLCLSYRAVNTGKPAPYAPPDWAAKLPPAEKFGRHIKHLGGEWWLEREGTIDTLYEAERSRDELIRITYGYWDFIKNRWPERSRAADFALTYVPINEGKRESRRLVGDYVFRQSDAQNAVMFPDRIAHGGWPMDVHHARGIYSGLEGPFHCNTHVPLYSIPFRSLYSVNVENLLMAGRNMSVTHIALGTVRVQGTLAAVGQAAGTAAALCQQRRLTPRELAGREIGLLQQTLLAHDQYIPGVKNEDPADLARGATITASSTARGETFGRWQQTIEKLHPLGMARGVFFPRGLGEEIRQVELYLENEGRKPARVRVHLRAAGRIGDFSGTEDLATAEAEVPAGRPTYVRFPLAARLATPYVWLWIDRTPGVLWGVISGAGFPCARAYGSAAQGKWTVVENEGHAFQIDPPLVLPRDFDVRHLVSGVGRMTADSTNQWASDPKERLPQWVELSFPQPQRISTVYLTFDTDMNAPFHTVPIVPQTVRDYELSGFDGKDWQRLAAVENNFQRRQVHRFAPVVVTKLRLTITATNGDPSARLFGVRVYGGDEERVERR